jgi:hypothetical protein
MSRCGIFAALAIGEPPAEARRQTSVWRDDCNAQRPHSSLGYLTPAECAARCVTEDNMADRYAASATDTLITVDT